MAKHTMVIVNDDLDGTQGAHTVAFALQGKSYEIDLTAENEKELRQILEPYIDSARKATQRQRATPTKSTSSIDGADRIQRAAIREWAKQRGMEVSERGRLPSNVVEAYDNAHR